MSPPERPADLVRPLPDPAATDRFGAALGRVLARGVAVLLWGDLGAGKSALARAAIRAVCGGVEVPSPTFTLAQVYEAEGFEIWHVDLYRLSGPDGVEDLGLFDAFDTSACLVEWPDRLGGEAPARRLDIALDIDGAGRNLRLWAGPGLEAPLRILEGA